MSTPNPCLRKGTWWGFGHEWNGTLEPFPWLKRSKIKFSIKRIHNCKNIHHWTKNPKCNTYTTPLKSTLWFGIPIVILTWWYKIPIVPMYITYNTYNPYTKTNFGNTCTKLLNPTSLKMFTYIIPTLYFNPTMFESPM
jgi:hypothetical protein